jgi:hypothetical protein
VAIFWICLFIYSRAQPFVQFGWKLDWILGWFEFIKFCLSGLPMTSNSLQFSGKCLHSVPIYCGDIPDGRGLCRLVVVVRCKWLRCHALIRVTKGSSPSQGVSWIECLFPPPQLANEHELIA